ncbi:MAG TPA: hypothetical protein VNT30_00785 [Stellaceae bacterium]|nr:hypothetical protein [Stellaceae bacterium]
MNEHVFVIYQKLTHPAILASSLLNCPDLPSPSCAASSGGPLDTMVGTPRYDPELFKITDGGTGDIHGNIRFTAGAKAYSGGHNDVFLVAYNEETKKLTDVKAMREINPHLFEFTRLTRAADNGDYDFTDVPSGKWVLFAQPMWLDHETQSLDHRTTFFRTMMLTSVIEIKNGQSAKLDISGATGVRETEN